MRIKGLGLQEVNKILLGVFLLLLGWFLLDTLLSLEKPKEPLIRPADLEVTDERQGGNIRQLSDFSIYAQEVKKRQLFKGTLLQDKPASPGITSEPSRTMPSDFQLLGIAAGENPQVIIQNKKTNQTYFLYEGQSQDNLKVEEISGNRVKLNYEGEAFERSL